MKSKPRFFVQSARELTLPATKLHSDSSAEKKNAESAEAQRAAEKKKKKEDARAPLVEAVDDAVDSVDELGNIEVDQQTKSNVTESEVR